MTEVVALGELLIDFTCKSTDEAGYPTMEAHPGGAPANYLAALAKFGHSTALLGKVGADAFGHLLSGTLSQAGIGTAGLVMDEAVFTTLAFVTLDSTGDRAFSFARKPGADTMLRFEELDLRLIEEAKVFHFGTLSLTGEPARTATRRAVAYAREHGVWISYDPNLRKPLWNSLEEAKNQLLWGLAQADVVKISEEEVEFLFGMDPETGAEHILQEFGVKLVFVTCGADGCWFRNVRAKGHVESLKNLSVIDTTGAGDIFGGAVMHGILQSGKAPDDLDEPDLRRIVGFACAAAGLSTTRPGGISSVPEPETVFKLL